MPDTTDLPDAEAARAAEAQAPTIGRRVPIMPLRWTGRFVPQIGQRVRVTSQDSRPGRVMGFFAAQGQLGVQITMDAPPDVWSRERSDRRQAMAFGHELAPDQAADE